MEPTRNSGAGSGNSSTYSPEITETLRFQEEIQSLMRDNSLIHPSFESPPVNGSSFTALLGLPPNQAVELLHHPESGHPPAPIATALGGEMWRFRPTFPSNASLVDRAARFSVFAAEDSPEAASDSGDHSSPMPKAEPAESGDCPICPIAVEKTQRLTGKRKEGEKSKVKGPAKKSKSGEERSTKPAEELTGGDRLPYVHVRARRGQATDSHSLAERARREKINARMKLLQELVPGCSKISGTALVLEEIINHVQSLQRQVEFLSMRLAAVNPRIDFNGLDTILSAECGRLTAGNGRSAVGLEQSPWLDGTTNGGRRQQQQLWHVDLVQSDQQQQATVWERDDTNNHVFISPSGTSLFGYDSSANSVSLSNQLKTEL